jgi:hypothetical protein
LRDRGHSRRRAGRGGPTARNGDIADDDGLVELGVGLEQGPDRVATGQRPGAGVDTHLDDPGVLVAVGGERQRKLDASVTAVEVSDNLLDPAPRRHDEIDILDGDIALAGTAARRSAGRFSCMCARTGAENSLVSRARGKLLRRDAVAAVKPDQRPGQSSFAPGRGARLPGGGHAMKNARTVAWKRYVVPMYWLPCTVNVQIAGEPPSTCPEGAPSS